MLPVRYRARCISVYIAPDIDMDSLMELLDAIEEDKRRYEAIPPNILKLALLKRIYQYVQHVYLYN